MKIKPPRLSRVRLSGPRWVAYTTASAATALTGAHSAEGAIHYSGTINATFRPGESKVKAFRLDQLHNAISFQHVANSTFAGFRLRFGSFRRNFPGYYYVENLAFGERVSGHTNSYFTDRGPGGEFGVMAWYAYRTSAEFLRPGIGFIGFRFNTGAGFQYGWARVNMAGVRKNNGFKLVDYAYADVGESITAGQTTSDEQPPIVGSLGWLALGGAGLIAWRQQRSRLAAQKLDCHTVRA
jgi:hypothetical protein